MDSNKTAELLFVFMYGPLHPGRYLLGVLVTWVLAHMNNCSILGKLPNLSEPQVFSISERSPRIEPTS